MAGIRKCPHVICHLISAIWLQEYMLGDGRLLDGKAPSANYYFISYYRGWAKMTSMMPTSLEKQNESMAGRGSFILAARSAS